MKYLTLKDAISEKQQIRKFICAAFNKKFIFRIYFWAGEMAQ